MAKERKTKTLTYKHVCLSESTKDLKTLLSESLRLLPTIGERRESLAPAEESPIWRLIGEFQDEENFVFGVMLRYCPGTNPIFVVDDDTAVKLTVEQLAVPATDDGKRRELVDAMLFFGVTENHLVMLQSSSLRSDHLENHLVWLLRKAGVVNDLAGLQLLDQPPKVVRDKLAASKVKELDIGGVLTPPLKPQPKPQQGVNQVVDPSVPASVVQHITASEDIGAGGIGVIDAIKRLLAPDQAAKIDFDSMSGANIEYVLKIKYRNQTTEDGQSLMNTLGSALRHAENVDTKIKLQGGGEIKGDELRLSGSVRLDFYNGVPALSEVFEAIRKWLLEKLKSGDVEAL